MLRFIRFLWKFSTFSTRSRKTVESEKVKWRQRVRQRPLFAAGCSAPGYHRKHIHHSAIQLNRQAWKSRLSDIFARLQHLHILLKFERRPFTALTKDTLPLKQQNSEHFFIRRSLKFPFLFLFWSTRFHLLLRLSHKEIGRKVEWERWGSLRRRRMGGRGGGMFTRPDISRSGLWGTAEKRDTNIGLKNWLKTV